MILLGAFNAVARYLGRSLGTNLSSNAWLEGQWYLFSIVFLFAAPYALVRDSHVRVDVLYSRLSERTKGLIDFLGSVLFLIPFASFAVVLSIPTAMNSWQVREMSSDPGGLARYPLKALVPIAFALLAVQGVSEAWKAWCRYRGFEIEPEDAGGQHEETS